jgi:hypothetical protein
VPGSTQSIIKLQFLQNLPEFNWDLHFNDEEAEAQKDLVTYPRSYRKWQIENLIAYLSVSKIYNLSILPMDPKLGALALDWKGRDWGEWESMSQFGEDKKGL